MTTLFQRCAAVPARCTTREKGYGSGGRRSGMSRTVESPDDCGDPAYLCNYVCLCAYIEENELTTGNACECSPKGFEWLVALVTVVHRPTERGAFGMFALRIRRTAVGTGSGFLGIGIHRGVWSSFHTLTPNSRKSAFPASVTISRFHSGLQTSSISADSTPSARSAACRMSSLRYSRAGQPV